MPRFFFNTIGKEKVHDPEGTELPSLADARMEALEDARDAMSRAILQGYDISSHRIEVCNEAGDVLLVVPFVDAILGRR
jgi:hypothetical protein